MGVTAVPFEAVSWRLEDVRGTAVPFDAVSRRSEGAGGAGVPLEGVTARMEDARGTVVLFEAVLLWLEDVRETVAASYGSVCVQGWFQRVPWSGVPRMVGKHSSRPPASTKVVRPVRGPSRPGPSHNHSRPASISEVQRPPS